MLATLLKAKVRTEFRGIIVGQEERSTFIYIFQKTEDRETGLILIFLARIFNDKKEKNFYQRRLLIFLK